MPHRNDFDFLMGQWLVRHRRLEKRLANDTNWIEFAGSASASKILNGLGNLDEITIPMPGDPYVGATLRLFNPTTQLWSIYWADTRYPELGPAVVGRFDGSHGVFFGDDTSGGTPVRVRFIWNAVSATVCTWEQAFSIDAGLTWEINWTMEFIRSHVR